MSVISNMPWGAGISPHLRKVLNRNGLDATITTGEFGQYLLNVTSRQGGDVRTYEISRDDAIAIGDARTDTAFKKGYATIAARARDFKLPPVAYARSVSPYVNVGYGGYRMWGDEFGATYAPYPGMPTFGYGMPLPRHGIFGVLSAVLGVPPYYGPCSIWTTGYPGRQPVAGEIPYNTGAVPRSGGYQGPQQAPAPRTANVDIGDIKVNSAWWEKEGAVPVPKAYSTVIPKAKDFTPAKFKSVLASHGIVISDDGTTVSLMTKALHNIPTVTLKKETRDKLLSPHLTSGHNRKGHRYTGVSLDERLAILSELMKKAGFKEGIKRSDLEDTKDDLYRAVTDEAQQKYDGKDVAYAKGHQAAQDDINRWAPMLKDWGYTDKQIRAVGYNIQTYAATHPEFAKLSPDDALRFIKENPDAITGVSSVLAHGNAPGMWKGDTIRAVVEPPHTEYKTGFVDFENAIAVVDGRALDKSKGFYLPVKDGKAVSVGEIVATPVGVPGKRTGFQMAAVINGSVYTHDIDGKTYTEFANSDDEHRFEVFDKVFDEVAIKNYRPGGGENYAVPSGDIKKAAGVASLSTNYSLVSGDTYYIIEDAFAVKDMAKNDYYLNIREGGDAGVWQFKMTDAQYRDWCNADDKGKAALIDGIAKFHDRSGKQFKAISDKEILTSGAFAYIENGKDRGKGYMHDVDGVEVYEGDKSRAKIDDPKKQPEFGTLPGDRKYHIDPKDQSNPDGLLKALDESEKPGTFNGIDTSGPKHHKWAGQGGGSGDTLGSLTDEEVMRIATEDGVAKDQIVLGKGQKSLLQARAAAAKRAILELGGTAGENAVNGRTKEGKMANRYFTRSGAHGRETDVADVRVDEIKDADGKPTGKYRMSAVIDGALRVHDISKDQFRQFYAVDDYGKLKLFDKIFDEVEMKHMPGTGASNRIIAGIAGALGIFSGVLAGEEMWRSRPRTVGGYYNPLVDSVRQAGVVNFEMQQEQNDRPSTGLNIGV